MKFFYEIEFDENRINVDSEVVTDALCEYYKGDGNVQVKDLNFRTFYPHMIAEQFSKIQPIPNDIKPMFPDLLKE